MSDLQFWQDQGKLATHTTALVNNALDDNSTMPVPTDDVIIFQSMDEYLPPRDFIVKSRKDIVIVVDQGHGTLKTLKDEQVGSALTIGYVYFVQGDDGGKKPDPKNPGKFLTAKAQPISALPDYVYDDPYYWISSPIQSTTATERDLTFDIGVLLADKLLGAGYTVYKTRNIRKDAPTNSERDEFANSQKADYFISLHADGEPRVGWYEVTGSHTIYRTDDDDVYNQTQLELATDVFRFYDVVEVTDNSPVQDTRLLRVLSPDQNLTPRKVIVELGFMSNPDDYAAMNDHQSKVARELAQGIDFNVRKHYFTLSEKVQGFFYNSAGHSQPPVIPPYLPDFKTIYEKVSLPSVTFTD